jgi:hypothetical protein
MNCRELAAMKGRINPGTNLTGNGWKVGCSNCIVQSNKPRTGWMSSILRWNSEVGGPIQIPIIGPFVLAYFCRQSIQQS